MKTISESIQDSLGHLTDTDMTLFEGLQRFNYSDLEVMCIQDKGLLLPGSYFYSLDDTVVPMEEFFKGSLNVFLLYNKKRSTFSMVDSGYGDTHGGTLTEKFKMLKVSPEQVSAVFITHIHPDHVGGLLEFDHSVSTEDEMRSVPSKRRFPKAIIYIAREEYETWQKDPLRAHLRMFLEPYREKIRLFEYESRLCGNFGLLVPHKRAGHTSGHTVYECVTTPCSDQVDVKRLAKMHETVYFVGDILHAIDLQVEHPHICSKYDMNPIQAAQSRQKVLQEVKGSLFGAHFPFPGRVSILKRKNQENESHFSYTTRV